MIKERAGREADGIVVSEITPKSKSIPGSLSLLASGCSSRQVDRMYLSIGVRDGGIQIHGHRPCQKKHHPLLQDRQANGGVLMAIIAPFVQQVVAGVEDGIWD